MIKFHREIWNSARFYEENADLLVNMDRKNITRSMTDYDSYQKVMPSQMSYEGLNFVDNLNWVVSFFIKG